MKSFVTRSSSSSTLNFKAPYLLMSIGSMNVSQSVLLIVVDMVSEISARVQRQFSDYLAGAESVWLIGV